MAKICKVELTLSELHIIESWYGITRHQSLANKKDEDLWQKLLSSIQDSNIGVIS